MEYSIESFSEDLEVVPSVPKASCNPIGVVGYKICIYCRYNFLAESYIMQPQLSLDHNRNR